MPSTSGACDGVPSYLHGHSALSRASSRHSGGRGWLTGILIPDTVLPVDWGDRTIGVSQAVVSDARARGVPVVETGVRMPWSRGRVD